MPLFEMRCLNNHQREVYAHNVIERACHTEICDLCHNDMAPILSLGRGLTYFAEGGKGKIIYNLGHDPVLVTSPKQHEDLMKAQGVTWAPPRRGMPGQWT